MYPSGITIKYGCNWVVSNANKLSWQRLITEVTAFTATAWVCNAIMGEWFAILNFLYHPLLHAIDRILFIKILGKRIQGRVESCLSQEHEQKGSIISAWIVTVSRLLNIGKHQIVFPYIKKNRLCKMKK